MKLKKLEEQYKTETNLNRFSKSQDLVTSAILNGWKIDLEVETNEEYDADDDGDYPCLVKTYVWAPERWDEDYIEELHLLGWTYPQALIQLATRLKKVIKNYNCPYCSMLNGVGKCWKSGQLNNEKMCIAFYRKAQTYLITNYDDFVSDTRTGALEIKHCPICGRKLC